MPQQLASFPDLKTGRGYSAVVLRPRPALPDCWAGPVNKVTVVSRDYLNKCMSSTPFFLFCPGLTQPVFFLLCCFNGAAHCHVRFYVSLSGSSVVCGIFRGSLQEHDCAISTTPKLHFVNFRINFPEDLLQKHGCKCIFKFFATQLSLFNDYECIYGTTYEHIHTYIHTYIHTDTACVQHVNVGLAQARPNYEYLIR